MSVKISKSIIATTLASMISLASSAVVADPLDKLHKSERQIHEAAAKSQVKVTDIYTQSQELLGDYRAVVDEYENLKVYNDHVAKLVADQQSEIDSFDRQIQEIVNTKRNVVPLMYRMIDTLEEFIKADTPVLLKERLERVGRLRDTMARSNVTTSERYRQVLEAYQIEKDYGSMIRAWQGTLDNNGVEVTVDYVHVGRIAFLAQSLDLKNAWVWNNQNRSWDKLNDEYLRAVTQTIRVARKQAAPDLIRLPIFAAE